MRRRGEKDETIEHKRIDTISREELEDMERRSGGPVISGEE